MPIAWAMAGCGVEGDAAPSGGGRGAANDGEKAVGVGGASLTEDGQPRTEG